MANEFDRYYINIRTTLGIDAKTIREELTTALEPNAPSYGTVTRWQVVFVKEEKMSMIIVQYPNLQVWFDRLSTMIHHIPLMMKL